MTTEQTETALDMKKGARGRKDKGQEAVIKMEALSVGVEDLIALKKKAEDASTAYADAIKATAEKAGLLAKVVRQFVDARAGDKFDDKKTEVGQLALCFDQVGINTGATH
jgi:hypothetical protein